MLSGPRTTMTFPLDRLRTLCVDDGVTPETEAELRAASPAARKAAILKARAEGASNYQIADVIGMSEAGVRKILKENTP